MHRLLTFHPLKRNTTYVTDCPIFLSVTIQTYMSLYRNLETNALFERGPKPHTIHARAGRKTLISQLGTNARIIYVVINHMVVCSGRIHMIHVHPTSIDVIWTIENPLLVTFRHINRNPDMHWSVLPKHSFRAYFARKDVVFPHGLLHLIRNTDTEGNTEGNTTTETFDLTQVSGKVLRAIRFRSVLKYLESTSHGHLCHL